MTASTVIHWFRKGLRLHDNAALRAACVDAKHVYPVFCLDPHFANPNVVGAIRYNFLLESLRCLDGSLRRLGSRLFVVRGSAESVLPELFDRWKVDRLTFEIDTEPFARRRDALVRELAQQHGVRVVACAGHTLNELDRYVAAYTKQSARAAKAAAASSTVSDAIVNVPLRYESFLKVFEAVESENASVATTKHEGTASAFETALEIPSVPSSEMLDAPQYNVPSLEEMGYSLNDVRVLYPGGELEALRRFREHINANEPSSVRWVCGFRKPQTRPNALEPDTTVLSPYLKFGCLSVRTMYRELKAICAKAPDGKYSRPPESLIGQLLWREFFYLVAYVVPNFDRIDGNRICRPIPWSDAHDERSIAMLEAWEFSRTGYPFIDAIMSQLRTEGWIHHLARHAVACFLTRGDLWQSWVEGARIFDRYLIDADWSLNNANWMWLSCSAFFHQYWRCYSPVAFGKKTDPKGDYIRKYVPALRRMPDAYIYEPWKAPALVQQQAGCIIGRDYPRPIVDHTEISKANIARMKECYEKAPESDPAATSTTSSSTKPTTTTASTTASTSSGPSGSSKRARSDSSGSAEPPPPAKRPSKRS